MLDISTLDKDRANEQEMKEWAVPEAQNGLTSY